MEEEKMEEEKKGFFGRGVACFSRSVLLSYRRCSEQARQFNESVVKSGEPAGWGLKRVMEEPEEVKKDLVQTGRRWSPLVPTVLLWRLGSPKLGLLCGVGAHVYLNLGSYGQSAREFCYEPRVFKEKTFKQLSGGWKRNSDRMCNVAFGSQENDNKDN